MLRVFERSAHANDAALTNFPIGAAPIKNNMLLRADGECINVVPRAERKRETRSQGERFTFNWIFYTIALQRAHSTAAALD